MRIEDFCREHDQRQNTIQKRVHDGIWPRGEFYSNPSGGQGYVHVARALAWLKEKGKIRGDVDSSAVD